MTDTGNVKMKEGAYIKKHERRDPLTKLFDAETFRDKTAEMLKAHPSVAFSFVCLDIDQFKAINDRFGVHIGDLVILRVAKLMRSEFGSSGVYGRIAGDRFEACIPSQDLDAEHLEEETDISFSPYSIDYSAIMHCGIYEVEDNEMSVYNMSDRAANALHTIKGNYLSRIAYYDETEHSMLSQELAGRMEIGLRQKEFEIYLQPIFSLDRQTPVAAEALVRWNHPDRGIIPPGEFIPLFENSQLIMKLDEYVWELACQNIKRAKDKGVKPVPLSVNMSNIDLHMPDLADRFVAVLQKYDIGPGEIELEITESAYMDFLGRLESLVEAAHKCGSKVLLDDFGSGFSSFGMLKDIDIDTIKIDSSFIRDVETKPRAGNVFNSIVHTAKMLGLEILSEGVETQGQIDFLSEIGCDLVQGYYFAKPMDEKEAMAFFGKYHFHREETYTERRRMMQGSFDIDDLWDGGRETSMLFESAPGGMGIYERIGDRLAAIRVNKRYFEITGTDVRKVFNSDHNISLMTPEKDMDALLKTCDAAETSNNVETCICRRKHEDGRMMWLEIRVSFIGRSGGIALYAFSLQELKNRIIYKSQKSSEELLNERMDIIKRTLVNEYVEGGLISGYLEHDTPLYYCDDSMARTLGYENSSEFRELTDGMMVNAIHPDDYNKIGSIVDRTAETGGGRYIKPTTCRMRTKSGEYIFTKARGIIADAENGRKVFIGFLLDVTRNVEADENMKWQIEKYRLLAESVHSIAFDYDVKNDVMRYEICEPGKETQNVKVEGYRAGARTAERISPETADCVNNTFEEAIRKPMSGTCDVRHDLFGGAFRWGRIYYVSMSDAENKVVRVVGRIDDIEKEKHMQKVLKRRADMDSLSGLLTRRATVERIAQMLKDPEQKENAAFMIIDMDNFKAVNDTLGHIEGDKVLTDVGLALQRAFRRSTDAIGRLGGDEFIVYFSGASSREQIEERFTNARKLIKAALACEGSSEIIASTDVSAGITLVMPGDVFTTLYQRADEALYEAKHLGGGRCVFAKQRGPMADDNE